jgi:hypothetical protein
MRAMTAEIMEAMNGEQREAVGGQFPDRRCGVTLPLAMVEGPASQGRKMLPQEGWQKSLAKGPTTSAANWPAIAWCKMQKTWIWENWWRGGDSNPRPCDYESHALTN